MGISRILNKKDSSRKIPKLSPLKQKEMGKRLRKVRLAKGLSQARVEALTNLPQSSLSKFENGEQILPSNYLCVLAEAYNVSTDYLIFGIYSEKYDDPLFSFCYQLSDIFTFFVVNGLIKETKNKSDVIISVDFNQFNSAIRSQCLSSYGNFATNALRIQNSRDLLGENLFKTRQEENKDKFLGDIEKLKKESG